MTSAKTQFITLFGKQYKVRCPSGQENVLKQTEDLLNQEILETKQNSGLTNREDIIMMTALNLCSQAVERGIRDEKEKRELAESQASAMLNQNQQPAMTQAQPRVRSQGSAIANAASKASQILKEKP